MRISGWSSNVFSSDRLMPGYSEQKLKNARATHARADTSLRQLIQQGPGITDLKLPALFHIQLRDNAIVKHSRIALRSYAHAPGCKIKLKPQLARPVGAAVGQHANTPISDLTQPAQPAR